MEPMDSVVKVYLCLMMMTSRMRFTLSTYNFTAMDMSKEERVAIDDLVKLSAMHINLSYVVALDKWRNGIPLEEASWRQHLVHIAADTAIRNDMSISEATDFLSDHLKGSQVVEISLRTLCELYGEDYTIRSIYRADQEFQMDQVYENINQLRKQMIVSLSVLRNFRKTIVCPEMLASHVFRLWSGSPHKTQLSRVALQRGLGNVCKRHVPHAIHPPEKPKKKKGHDDKKKAKNKKKQHRYKELKKKHKKLNHMKKEQKKHNKILEEFAKAHGKSKKKILEELKKTGKNKSKKEKKKMNRKKSNKKKKKHNKKTKEITEKEHVKEQNDENS